MWCAHAASGLDELEPDDEELSEELLLEELEPDDEELSEELLLEELELELDEDELDESLLEDDELEPLPDPEAGGNGISAMTVISFGLT